MSDRSDRYGRMVETPRYDRTYYQLGDTMGQSERKGRDVRVSKGASDPALADTVDGSIDSLADTVRETVAEANRRAACSTLSYLLLRGYGVLKFFPSKDGKESFAKYTWREGKWSGHYVMARFGLYEWDRALLKLRDKVEEVDMGLRNPAKDTPWADPVD